jgi:hypothetical protein
MKIAIIGDSSLLYMPYVNNYVNLLNKKKVSFTIINWDRFQMEDIRDEYKYRDKKVGHRRGYLDYFKYCKFIKKRLNEENFDRLIICGIPLAYFLKKYLLKYFKGRYIIDIRDYHKIIKITSINNLVENSVFTVLSSPGFKEWLPKVGKYYINHNTQIYLNSQIEENTDFVYKERINVAYIGALRDYQLNIDLVNSLKNNNSFTLLFHGEGEINKDIQQYLQSNNIQNVYLTGRYMKETEMQLYKESDIINVLIPNDEINSRTLLPNRLYNAAINGKPILTFHGTYLAEQIRKYNLGLVIKSLASLENILLEYLISFDQKKFKQGRKDFLAKVIKENREFNCAIYDFIRT